MYAQLRPEEPEPVFLFVHVMKTAGTSLLAAAHQHFGRERVEPSLDLRSDPGDPWEGGYTSLARLRDIDEERRAGVRFYAGHYPLLARELVQPDVILTVLREPVERTVSLLRQAQRMRPAMAGRSLEEIYDDPWTHSTMVRDYQVKLFAMTPEELRWTAQLSADLFGLDVEEAGDRPHLMPYEMDAERLERAKANLEQVDEIGLQAQFGSFLERLGRDHGWSVEIEPELRRAPEGERVPDTLVERIRADLAWDCEFYDFAVDLCERRARGR